MTIKGLLGDRTISLAATEYTPSGSGPFPAIVISHGVPANPQERAGYTAKYVAASTAFVKMGFVVLNPVRRGYGKTGGTFEEDSSGCRFFADAGLETAKDIAAAVSYLRRHPAVDGDRLVLVGQSGGGWGSLAAATREDVPIKGVVNFAGGRGGKHQGVPYKNCQPDWLVADTRKYGKAARVPSLWIYAENDHYFGPEVTQRMYKAYTEAGGKATLLLVPPFGEDGHTLFGSAKGVPIWRDRVDAFLREIGVLTRSGGRGVPPLPPAPAGE
jgi:dienelactone hydrolase